MESQKEKVLIVGVVLPKDDIEIEDSLDELEELVKAAGGRVEARIVQNRDRLNAAFYIGKGKAEEIQDFCENLEIDTVVFNNELSGAQLRNLEELIDRKIIDRTTLILDIFALRAESKEGKLQVKLAQLQYRLPRLVGFRDYLSREGAGIGTRGPGEQKLEIDRRHILREISNIEKQLQEIVEGREIKRKKRVSSQLPMVSLLGYTNAGKSTLMNQLMKRDNEYEGSKSVFVKDMLFASLDTSHRTSKLPSGQTILLSDTVGFVSQLPTKLIEAFKGTIEEVENSDLLIHVLDASSKDLDLQIKTTIDLLKDLEIVDIPIITVLNKMDKIDENNPTRTNINVENPIYISALNDINIDELLKLVQEKLPMVYREVDMFIPYKDQSISSSLMNDYEIKNLEYVEDGLNLSFTINHIDYEKYKKYII